MYAAARADKNWLAARYKRDTIVAWRVDLAVVIQIKIYHAAQLFSQVFFVVDDGLARDVGRGSDNVAL